jgi:hypothetical protein
VLLQSFSKYNLRFSMGVCVRCIKCIYSSIISNKIIELDIDRNGAKMRTQT